MKDLLAFIFWFLAFFLFFSLLFTPGGGLILFLLVVTLLMFLPFVIFGLIFGVLMGGKHEWWW